jgi:hypothetical protein
LAVALRLERRDIRATAATADHRMLLVASGFFHFPIDCISKDALLAEFGLPLTHPIGLSRDCLASLALNGIATTGNVAFDMLADRL